MRNLCAISMMRRAILCLCPALALAGNGTAPAQVRDVTQPGDPIISTSNNSPGSNGPFNAIDNDPTTKYLNFDKLNTGFTVEPQIGLTIVNGLTITSSDDAPERDPASFILFGVYDFTNLTQITSGTLPAFTGRRHKQTILFENETPYLGYKLIFPTLSNAATAVAMQVAEVELLGKRPGETNLAICNSGTLIQRQPSDTPVLSGARATFRVGLTSQWDVQWYRNGEIIDGATESTYVTPPVSVGDEGARYHVVVTSPLCSEHSEEATHPIFTPSSTESIGLNFTGQTTATGPGIMFPEDITGMHSQAYWENVGGVSGARDHLLNSSNEVHPTIAVQWESSGEWNSGVGFGFEDSAARMFQGFGQVFGTNDTNAQSTTFTGVPPGDHSVFVYTAQARLESFDLDFEAITFRVDGTVKSIQQRFIHPEDANEFDAAPGFRLVNSDQRATRGVGNTIRFDHLRPDDGRILIRFFSPERYQPPPPAPQFRGPGVSGLQLVVRPTADFGILMTPSNHVLLWWPATTSNITVETTGTLGPPDWQPVLEQPVLQDGLFELRLPASEPQRYFRIRH